jgi:hypothetical protein
MKTLVSNLTQTYKQQATYWSGSLFEDVVNFSTDYKGRWGEELFRNILKEYTDILVQWDEDSNTSNDDGVYDLFWYLRSGEKVRVEVKTSGRTVSKGVAKGWQHENVYFSGHKWDKLVFIDYDVNNVIYFTIVDYDQVVKNDIIDLSLFGKKAHCRKNEEGKAKVDFSLKSIQNGIDAGVTFCYNINDPQDELLGLFLFKKLDK